MTIKILVSCSGMNCSFTPGQEYNVSDIVGKDLIDAGYAEAVKKTSRKKADTAKGDGDA